MVRLVPRSRLCCGNAIHSSGTQNAAALFVIIAALTAAVASEAAAVGGSRRLVQATAAAAGKPAANNTANTNASLGAWAEGTNFGTPVTAKGFRFGTRGQNVTLGNAYCGFGPLSSRYAVGVSPDSPLVRRRPLAGCGTCLEVACARGSPACLHPDAVAGLTPASSALPAGSASATSPVLAPGRLLLTVADSCDTCGPLDLNMHADAFAQLADPRVGVMNLTYRQVSCPALGHNLSVYVSAFRGSDGGWLRLSVRDVAGQGLAAAAIAHCPRPGAAGNDTGSGSGNATNGSASNRAGGAGGGLTPGCAGTLRGPSWRVMQNTVGAQWEYSGLPRLPLDLRLTDVTGAEIIVWGAITGSGAPAEYPTRAQFPESPPEDSGPQADIP